MTSTQNPYATQSYNGYAYCMNNPLKYTDPSGYKLDPNNWWDLGAEIWISGVAIYGTPYGTKWGNYNGYFQMGVKNGTALEGQLCFNGAPSSATGGGGGGNVSSNTSSNTSRAQSDDKRYVDKYGNKITPKSEEVVTGVSLLTTVIDIASKGNLAKLNFSATVFGAVTGVLSNGYDGANAFANGDDVVASISALQVALYVVGGGLVVAGSGVFVTIGATILIVNTAVDFVEYGYKNY